MMTLWRIKENEWALSLREELSSTPIATTLHKHLPYPKSNQKQNQNPLKLSFFMNSHGCSEKMKMKNKGGRGKTYYTKDNYVVPTRRKKNIIWRNAPKTQLSRVGFHGEEEASENEGFFVDSLWNVRVFLEVYDSMHSLFLRCASYQHIVLFLIIQKSTPLDQNTLIH